MTSYLFLIIVIAVVIAILAIATFTKFKLTNEQYDRLKWLALHWDVFAIFLSLVVKLFDMPYGFETVSLVVGIGAALGGILDIANKNYEGEKITKMFNEDLLKEMVGYEEYTEEDEEVN